MTPSNSAETISQGLVSRAQRGDEEALRTLVERAYPMVRRWALVRTGDPTEADDLCQDVLVQVVRRLESFERTAQFTTWLYVVTRNAAADRHRRRKRLVRIEGDPRAVTRSSPDVPTSADAAVDRGRIADLIRSAFMSLPARQREVFDLVELQGLSSPEVARRLGIEAVSVRAHLFKARRALRRRILELHPEIAEEWT